MSATFGLQILVWYPSNPLFLCWCPWFLIQNISSVYHRLFCPSVDLERTCALREWGGVGRGHKDGEKLFADVIMELLWRAIYFSNPRLNAGSQSRYRSRRGMGSRHLCNIPGCELVTEVSIRLLIQNRTCKMSSSIFSAMSWLKFASTTRSSLPSIPSTEISNGEKFFCW